jgi:hypothetical protein
MFKATTSLGIPIAKDPLSDFRKFLFVIWKHLNLPDPTPVQYDIAYNLQHGDNRMIIEAFFVPKRMDAAVGRLVSLRRGQ